MVLLITELLQYLANSKGTKDFELVLYTKTGMGDGQQANNPGYKSFLILSQEFLGITM
jgi:hypothetical protein